MVKAQELIDVALVRDETLPLYARQVYNLLLRNAHGPDMLEKGKTFTIETAKLTTGGGSLLRLNEALTTLQKTVVRIFGGQGGSVSLLGWHNLEAASRRIGLLDYRMDAAICEILAGSTVYAQLDMEVMTVVRSKYALSLYESMARRAGLKRVHDETFTLEYFRDAILQVEKSKFPRYGQLKQSAIVPAMHEVNALAHFTLTWVPIKTGRAVTHIRVFWRIKDEAEMPAVGAEMRRRRPVVETAPLFNRSGTDPLLDV